MKKNQQYTKYMICIGFPVKTLLSPIKLHCEVWNDEFKSITEFFFQVNYLA